MAHQVPQRNHLAHRPHLRMLLVFQVILIRQNKCYKYNEIWQSGKNIVVDDTKSLSENINSLTTPAVQNQPLVPSRPFQGEILGSSTFIEFLLINLT